ncbi:2-hydroxyacid dehydrogenase [Streptomyces althioticus]|uniref:2-hydroxyacid dehydrogenase n=1 Tax=Streptomyces althioticus TaxID=83380 RepID=UPI0036AA7403
MQDGTTVWLPYGREHLSGLPTGLSYGHWDGSPSLPGDPGDVRFLVAPPIMGSERLLADVLPRMKHLEVLQLLSSGYDHVRPLLPAMPPGARLATARGVHGEATAELAVALLLAMVRGIDRFVGGQAEGRWRPEVRATLSGKRVLVVGHGAVGEAVAARLSAFRCEVVPVARTARPAPGGMVHGTAELPALLPTVDAVVLCAPLTEQTRGMIDADALALMKDGASLVNVARGELVDTEALVREVTRGRIRAALDVTDPEPLPPGHPLWRSSGVLITPHVAAFTDAFVSRSSDFLRQQLHRYARGQNLDNVVLTTAGPGCGEEAA